MTDELIEDLETIASGGSHARNKEQHEKAMRAKETGKCDFCPPHEFKFPFIREGRWWSVKPNDYPYEGHSRHLVFIFREHTNDVSRVLPQAWAEFGELFQSINPQNGALVMRFGLSEFNASTMRHLHAHWQEIDIETTKKRTSENFPHIPAFDLSHVADIGRWSIVKITNLPDNLLDRFVIILEPGYSLSKSQYLRRVAGPIDWEMLGMSLRYCIERFELPGGGIVIPIGPPEYNSRIITWEYEYAEILVPRGPNMNVRAEFVPGFYRASATFSKDPSREKDRKKRTAEFTKGEK